MREHFRGVVWPREAVKGQYRYVVIGMLVTDEPIPELEADQIVLDGNAAGMKDSLAVIRQVPSDFRGDANAVLHALSERLVKEE
jgi:hypothetical protein